MSERRPRLTKLDVVATGAVDGMDNATANSERVRLIELIEQLDIQAAMIRDQIREAVSAAHDRGVYSDSAWFRRVNGAKAAISRNRQAAQLRLGEVNRRIRFLKSPSNSWAERFVAVARRDLDAARFDQLRVATDDLGRALDAAHP